MFAVTSFPNSQILNFSYFRNYKYSRIVIQIDMFHISYFWFLDVADFSIRLIRRYPTWYDIPQRGRRYSHLKVVVVAVGSGSFHISLWFRETLIPHHPNERDGNNPRSRWPFLFDILNVKVTSIGETVKVDWNILSNLLSFDVIWLVECSYK